MDHKDYVGLRGERLFPVLIGKWCDGRPWFIDSFLGEKHPATDFVVELVDPTCHHATMYVQIKATEGRYTGKGKDRKIDMRVSAKKVEELKRIHAPVYIVAIDILTGRGYIQAITQSTKGGIAGISTRNPLNCRAIKRIWREVDDYWKGRPTALGGSRFE